MMDPVLLLQVLAAFVLSIGYCWLLGSLAVRTWLLGRGAAAPLAPALRGDDLTAAGVAILGAVLVLVAGAAAMSGLPLLASHQALLPMLGTGFGRTGLALLAALCAYLALRWYVAAPAWWPAELGLLLLVTLVRSSMGHAGEAGLLTPVHVAEALHLAGIGAWVGIVLLSAGPVLAGHTPLLAPGAGSNRYLARMSAAAMLAVLVVAVTGLYSAWHRLGDGAALLPATAYVLALALKLSMVAVALGLGGFNKWHGLPLAAREPTRLAVVRAVLQIEAGVLLAALLAAAWLTVLAPPLAA